MSLVVRFDKDGKRIPFTKAEIERERQRRDRYKRRAADGKRKRREEKRLDRKNVRTPPGKPGVGVKRTTGKRLSAKDKAAALKLREVALKKIREGQVKKEKAKKIERPGKRPAGLTVTPRGPGLKAPGSGTRVRRPAPGFPKQPSTPRRKVPGVKAPGSGNRKKPVGILDRKNPVTRKFMSRLVHGKNSRGQRSQTKKGKGL